MTRRIAFLAAAVLSAAFLCPASARATPTPSLFVAAHPDDETLAMSVAIAEHVRAGQDVHVLWLSDGGASGVRSILNGTGTATWWGVTHTPAAEGYTPLSVADFETARIREATNAVRQLATGYPGTLTVHRASLPDGTITQADAEAAIVAVADAIAPAAPVKLKTHSQVDNHPDHLAASAAAVALKAADPVRFGDVRHYVLPAYWSDSRLSTVTESFDTPADSGVTARCKNAYRAFAAWDPPHTFAVGYHSVPSMFAAIDGNPRSMVHP